MDRGVDSTGNCSLLEVDADSPETSDKKPSYINLACSVNGYSSITTYDSKIRQDINKSREVSPIRASTTAQYCKKGNASATAVQIAMSNIGTSAQSLTPILAIENNNWERNGHGNIYNNFEEMLRNSDDNKGTSFIQQRVERLYGPGALAQGFYNPKKIKAHLKDKFSKPDTTELLHKFKQLSPSRDYKVFNKKVAAASSTEKSKASEKTLHSKIDLPVLRHLSEEFRAQLPSISPKRGYIQSNENSSNQKKDLTIKHTVCGSTACDEIDRKTYNTNLNYTSSKKSLLEIGTLRDDEPLKILNVDSNVAENMKDGRYFLRILENEQERILSLANEAEKYVAMLSNNTEISEDTLGILRSASGKARLLVTQKMKQFEGLCHNNLNSSIDDRFPTTEEDLQGFWDMVYLQVENINSSFKEIELLKQNNWKKPALEISSGVAGKEQNISKRGKTKIKTQTNSGNNISTTTTAISASAIKREAQRKQLTELKRKHKMASVANFMPLETVASNVGKNSDPEMVAEQKCS